MIKCERGKNNPQRCDSRRRQTFCNMGNVYVLNIASICIHEEELLRQLAFHQKYRRSHNETDVRHIWKVGDPTVRRDLLSENNFLGRLFMEVFVFDWWWRSHQPPAHKSLRILRFCVVSWKDEREPSVKYCMGRQIDVVQKFTRVQSFWTELMVSQWNSSVISSQDSPHCSSATKSKSYC